MKRLLCSFTIALACVLPSVVAQEQTFNHAGSSITAGPHGGSLKQAGGLRLETIVHQGGIQMYAYDSNDQPLSAKRGRGSVSLRLEGNAKRYRYDLLPDGKGGLTAPVDLSAISGRQVQVDITLVGLSPGSVSLTEVATVPASEAQLAAAAIARQKTCPVSGKPLGSMGEPVSVAVGGERLFVCCAGCAGAVKANPTKYLTGRVEITVSSATKADAPLIAAQKKCPVMDESLGSMGNPIKVMVGEKPIFLCCKGCIKRVQSEPAKYLAKVYGKQQPKGSPAGEEAVRPGVFKVADADKPFIDAQKKCPVMDEPLYAMGGPYKVDADGKAIYICCPGCAKMIAKEPQEYIAKLKSEGVEAPPIR